MSAFHVIRAALEDGGASEESLSALEEMASLLDFESRGRDGAHAALAAAEAEAACYRAGIRAALRTLHAVHSALPDGETVPRQSADAMALAVEGALLAALGVDHA